MKNILKTSVVFLEGMSKNDIGEHAVGFVYKELEHEYIIITVKHLIIDDTTLQPRDIPNLKIFKWKTLQSNKLINQIKREILPKVKINHYLLSRNKLIDLAFISVSKNIKLVPFETGVCCSEKTVYRNQVLHMEKCQFKDELDISIYKYYKISDFVNENDYFEGEYTNDIDHSKPYSYLHVGSAKDINPGYSGSPIVAESGLVMGIIIAKDKSNQKSCRALYYTIDQIDQIYNSLTQKNSLKWES